nr:vegetative cell wall protein gp1-like [Aegilops tauschii subsp. strangulata]
MRGTAARRPVPSVAAAARQPGRLACRDPLINRAPPRPVARRFQPTTLPPRLPRPPATASLAAPACRLPASNTPLLSRLLASPPTPTDAPPDPGLYKPAPRRTNPLSHQRPTNPPPRRPTHPPSPATPPMAFYRGSTSAGAAADDGGVPGSFPTSLGVPETEELHRYCLLKIDADGYPTPGPGATEEELRSHSGGRHNTLGRHNFWRGKDYWEVITAFRLAAAGVTPDLTGGSGRLRAPPPPRDRRGRADHRGAYPAAAPVPTAPPSPPELELPPEQVILREDGDPDDTPGYHVALRASEAASAASAREATEVAAAIEAAEAMAAEQVAMAPAEWQQPPPEWQQEWQPPPPEWQQQPAEVEDDDPVDWDDLANRSSSDGPVVVDLGDSDEE